MKKSSKLFMATLIIEVIIIAIMRMLFNQGTINAYVLSAIILIIAVASVVITQLIKKQAIKTRKGVYLDDPNNNRKLVMVFVLGAVILIMTKVFYNQGTITNDIALIITVIDMLIVNVLSFRIETR